MVRVVLFTNVHSTEFRVNRSGHGHLWGSHTSRFHLALTPVRALRQQLLDFYELSYDEDALDRAVEAASFENMKALEQSQAFPSPWLRPRNNAPKVRKGKVGGYLEELPPGDIAYLNEVFGLT